MDVWQPWQPQVGDRVRVSVSAECGGYHDVGRGPEFFPNHPRDKDGRPIDNGATGTVIAILGPMSATRHWYGVSFDTPRYYAPLNETRRGSIFSAIELEPLRGVELVGEQVADARGVELPALLPADALVVQRPRDGA